MQLIFCLREPYEYIANVGEPGFLFRISPNKIFSSKDDKFADNILL
jgi:hypothetical protein